MFNIDLGLTSEANATILQLRVKNLDRFSANNYIIILSAVLMIVLLVHEIH